MAIEQWLVDGPKTIDIQTVRRVNANLMGGTINIIAHDEPSARVEITALTGRNVKVSIDGDQLLIDHPQLSVGDIGTSVQTVWDQPRVEVSVLVPRRVGVTIKGVSSEVLVSGVRGPVSVTTVGGDQFLDGVVGVAHLSAISGEVSVRDHEGALNVKTVSGDITVAGAIDNYTGTTVTGRAVIDITAGLPDNISHTSASGDVTTRVPDDVAPNFKITTVTSSGNIDGMPLEPQRGSTWIFPADERSNRHTDVRFVTFGGRISFLRSGTPSGEREGRYAKEGASTPRGAAEQAGAGAAAGASGTEGDAADPGSASTALPNTESGETATNEGAQE